MIRPVAAILLGLVAISTMMAPALAQSNAPQIINVTVSDSNAHGVTFNPEDTLEAVTIRYPAASNYRFPRWNTMPR